MSKKFTLECMGEDVVVEIDDEGIYFHGDWEPEEEEMVLLIEGGVPSPCLSFVRNLEELGFEEAIDLALVTAAGNNNIRAVSALLAVGANAAYNGSEALTAAIYSEKWYGEHDTVVKKLIKEGADANALNGAALFGAIINDNLSLAKFLLKNGATIRGNMLNEAIASLTPRMLHLVLTKMRPRWMHGLAAAAAAGPSKTTTRDWRVPSLVREAAEIDRADLIGVVLDVFPEQADYIGLVAAEAASRGMGVKTIALIHEREVALNRFSEAIIALMEQGEYEKATKLLNKHFRWR